MKPKLTLRDLFWLVLVCAFALGWWLDRGQLDKWHKRRFDSLSRHAKEELMLKLDSIDGFIVRDDGNEVRLLHPNGRRVTE